MDRPFKFDAVSSRCVEQDRPFKFAVDLVHRSQSRIENDLLSIAPVLRSVAAKARVKHRKRGAFDKAHPVHVTLRMRDDFRKHAYSAGRRLANGWFDHRSSAAKFDGWRGPLRTRFSAFDFGTAPARTWLLGHGWRRHGLLALDERPAVAPTQSRRAA